MAVLVPVKTSPAGSDKSVQSDGVAADVAGDTFPYAAGRRIAFANGSGGPIVATIATPGKADGNDIEETAVTIAAGETQIAGPFVRGVYADASGDVSITYDDVTSLTVLVFD